MTVEGLTQPLRATVRKYQTEGKAVRQEGILTVTGGRQQALNLEVLLLKHRSEVCYLVL